MTDSVNDRPLPSQCVASATLAAYVEGRLPPTERATVESHLAGCDTCYEVMAEVVRTDEAFTRPDALAAPDRESSAYPPVRAAETASGPRWRQHALAGGVLAVAASILIALFVQRPTVSPLVEIVGPERLTVARLTGGFEYGPIRSQLRGPALDDDRRLRLMAEVARLRETAGRTGSPDAVHALAVAELLAGDTEASLETFGSLSASSARSSAFETDLGAAWMTSYLETRSPDDAARALAAFERAVALEPDLPEALFNKAWLLEAAGRRDEALRAWERYLAIDDGSSWADEARRHLDSLR